MKGGGGIGGKRRWRGLVIAVLGLVFLSMLVPLVFLLGFHNGFTTTSSTTTTTTASSSSSSSSAASTTGGGGGYDSDQPHLPSASSRLRVFDQHKNQNHSQQEQSTHTDEPVRTLPPTLPQDYRRHSGKEAEKKTTSSSVLTDLASAHSQTNTSRQSSKTEVTEIIEGINESDKLCELTYGSYCLWRKEHKEKMKDFVVKRMKDQLYVARAYYPSIAKLPALDKLSQELKQNIQEYERVLSESATDTDLPSQIKKKLQKMDDVISRAKSYPVDCNNVDKKLRQLVDLTEDEAYFHSKQSAFLYQLAVQTMPKSLHCLSMRLTVEYFRSPSLDMEELLSEKFLNPELQHYVIFSNNVLASSVVVNSTVMHAKESGSQVFHVLTDRQNYFAMKYWFFINIYKEATVRVLNIEDLKMNPQDKGPHFQLSAGEFRISFSNIGTASTSEIITEYMSVFSHYHYLLPEIFQNLNKVVVLDDDIVVQRDLSAIWSIDMSGKVNGAVQFCKVRLGQLKHSLGKNIFDWDSCAWMSGLNIIDLVRWREHDVTKTFQRLVQELNREEEYSKSVTLRASLLTFQGLVHTLDNSWVLPGLGHNYSLDLETAKNAAVLHFNGKMKPWLELGIPKYKGYWRKYMNRKHQFLSDCNVNP